MGRVTTSERERGMALVLALGALLVLTVIGLSLAAISTIEVQCAANYRWSRKAFYNAEAGIAIGQTVLSDLSWTYALPSARTPWPPEPPGGAGHRAPFAAGRALTGEPSRDHELAGCDERGNGMGYGVVLFDGTRQYQNVAQVQGHQLDGAFTLWVRRPVIVGADGTMADYPHDDVLILVSEGVAPVARSGLVIAQASQVIEVTLYSSYTGVSIGPPLLANPSSPVVMATRPYKLGSSVCH
jgi:hypothetical protein